MGIYANFEEASEDNIQKAIDYYKAANTVEADRNLLALYLKNRMDDEALSLMNSLLEQKDIIVCDFVSFSLFGKPADQSATEQLFINANADNIMSLMFEWIDTTNYYRGFNPPTDSALSRWIFQGTDFTVSGSANHPYSVYREQRAKCAEYISTLEKTYYMYDGRLLQL